ncbi:MAG TPA: PRC-barrel domain-containing protein [Stellaceae bacterium]|nr:PRC-barrel domain-containing protein [Stellaceae bacterium]
MSKPAVTAALAVLMTMAAPVAFAQNMAQPALASRPMSTSPASLTLQPNQMRASKLIGSSVYDVQNQDIGSVKDLVLDRDGKIAAVVLDVGSFLGVGGKFVAVSLADIKTDNNRLTLDRTKAQLKSAQAYNLTPKNENTNQAGH